MSVSNSLTKLPSLTIEFKLASLPVLGKKPRKLFMGNVLSVVHKVVHNHR